MRRTRGVSRRAAADGDSGRAAATGKRPAAAARVRGCKVAVEQRDLVTG